MTAPAAGPVQALVLTHGAALQRAVEMARGQGLPVSVPVEHLAQSVLDVLAKDGGLPGPERIAAAIAGRGRVRPEDGGSILSDFVWSLACEQQPDWRIPGFTEEGARDALAALYSRHAPWIARVAGAHADDLVPMTILQAFRTYWDPAARKRFRGEASLRTLFRWIVRSLARDVRPLPGMEDEQELALEAPEGGEPGRDDPALFRARLADCIDRLPPKRRLVVRLRLIEELTPGRVEESLGISPQSQANHLSRAQDPLRECLGKHGYGPDTRFSLDFA